MSETVAVWPKQNETEYRGFSFSITLYSGTLDEALAKADEFIAAHEAGVINLHRFRVSDPADQRPSNDKRNASPAPPRTAAPNGKPIITFDVVKVELERDAINKKTYIGIFKVGDKFPTVRINQDSVMWEQCCTNLSDSTGIDWFSGQIGLIYTTPGLLCGYTESDNVNDRGKPYKDFVGIRRK